MHKRKITVVLLLGFVGSFWFGTSGIAQQVSQAYESDVTTSFYGEYDYPKESGPDPNNSQKQSERQQIYYTTGGKIPQTGDKSPILNLFVGGSLVSIALYLMKINREVGY